MFVTFLSILIGLVLADLVGMARARADLWPPASASLRTWLQLAFMVELIVLSWLAYVHVGVARRAVPAASDVLNPFLFAGYLFFMNCFVGVQEAYVWFYLALGSAVISTFVTILFVRQARKEPELRSFAPLAAFNGPLLLNYLLIPYSCAAGVASQAGWLAPEVETAILVSFLIPSPIWMYLFLSRWRSALAGE